MYDVHMNTNGPYLSNFLRQYAPDFCYMSANDYLLFVEQEFEDVDPYVLRSTMTYSYQKGWFSRKGKGGIADPYLYIFNPQFRMN